jgi:hypothetical protein
MFTVLRIVKPTMSESLVLRTAYSIMSVTLARKWDMGLVSPPVLGDNNRTVSCVPVALKRWYRLCISLSIVNLEGSATSSGLWDLGGSAASSGLSRRCDIVIL